MKELVVYSKPSCKYCVQAKQFFKDLDIPFREVDLTKQPHLGEWLVSNGYKFLPAILVNDSQFMPGGWNTIRTMRRHEILERLK